MQDVTYFLKDSPGVYQQLPCMASDHDIITAGSATLKLDNQNNGWKSVGDHQLVLINVTARSLISTDGHQITIQQLNSWCAQIRKA